MNEIYIIALLGPILNMSGKISQIRKSTNTVHRPWVPGLSVLFCIYIYIFFLLQITHRISLLNLVVSPSLRPAESLLKRFGSKKANVYRQVKHISRQPGSSKTNTKSEA